MKTWLTMLGLGWLVLDMGMTYLLRQSVEHAVASAAFALALVIVGTRKE